MFDTFARINLREQELHEGLNQIGVRSMVVPATPEQMMAEVHDHAINIQGNPQVTIYGIREGQSKYDPDEPNAESVSVDLVNGDVGKNYVLPKGNMGDFQLEKQAFDRQWGRVKDIEPRITTPRALDVAIGTAMLLAGTREKSRAIVEQVQVVPLRDIKGRDVNPNKLVFGNYTKEMRAAYGQGDDNQAFALASVLPQIGRFPAYYRVPGEEETVTFKLDNDDWKLYEKDYGAEAHTIQLRALDRIIETGVGRDNLPMTELELRRLKLVYDSLRADFKLTRMTIETTLTDITEMPNTANP